MVILDVAIVNVALPSIDDGLHFSNVGLQWVVNAYTLTFAGFLMLGGRAAHLLAPRRGALGGCSSPAPRCSHFHRWPARSRTRAACWSARGRCRASAVPCSRRRHSR